MESMQQHDFIMAHSLYKTHSSLRSHPCQNNLSSVGRFQTSVFTKKKKKKKKAPAIYQIQKSLASLSQGTMTVSSYFTKLKGLWDELDVGFLSLNLSYSYFEDNNHLL